MNRGIETAGGQFDRIKVTPDFDELYHSRVLVIFSDFFSTDFDHPDKKVANLAKKGIRTIAVGVSDKVVHTNWMVTGLLQDRNLYLSEKSGDMKRLGQEIKTLACDVNKKRLFQTGKTYKTPDDGLLYSANDIAKFSQYYKKVGELPEALPLVEVLVPEVLEP